MFAGLTFHRRNKGPATRCAKQALNREPVFALCRRGPASNLRPPRFRAAPARAAQDQLILVSIWRPLDRLARKSQTLFHFNASLRSLHSRKWTAFDFCARGDQVVAKLIPGLAGLSLPFALRRSRHVKIRAHRSLHSLSCGFLSAALISCATRFADFRGRNEGILPSTRLAPASARSFAGALRALRAIRRKSSRKRVAESGEGSIPSFRPSSRRRVCSGHFILT